MPDTSRQPSTGVEPSAEALEAAKFERERIYNEYGQPAGTLLVAGLKAEGDYPAVWIERRRKAGEWERVDP